MIRFYDFGCGRVRLCRLLKEIFAEELRPRLFHLHNALALPELLGTFVLFAVVENDNFGIHRGQLQFFHDFVLDGFGFFADFVVTVRAYDADFVVIAASVANL